MTTTFPTFLPTDDRLTFHVERCKSLLFQRLPIVSALGSTSDPKSGGYGGCLGKRSDRGRQRTTPRGQSSPLSYLLFYPVAFSGLAVAT